MLASTEWLASHLDDPGLVVVDLRWREDGSGRMEYEQAHVPGAVFLDWATDLVDPGNPVAVMLADPGRFAADPDGVARTPRGAIRAGRVPWAVNVPAASLYHEDATLKTPDEIRSLLSRVGVQQDARVVTYCGVGLSAAALAFALRSAGIDE